MVTGLIVTSSKLVDQNYDIIYDIKLFQPSPRRFDDERDQRQVHSSSKSNSKEMSDDQKSHVYEITLLRSEAKRLIAENRELKR